MVVIEKDRKTDQEDGNGKGSGDPKDQENQKIRLLPTYSKNPTTRRKKLSETPNTLLNVSAIQ